MSPTGAAPKRIVLGGLQFVKVSLACSVVCEMAERTLGYSSGCRGIIDKPKFRSFDMPSRKKAARKVRVQAPKPVTPGRARIMRSIRSKNTRPELALRAELRAAGLRGYRVNLRGLPGRPDVAFTRQKLAVLVHGCFWHRCPNCHPHEPRTHTDYWKAKFIANQRRDDAQVRMLAALGWEVLEIWECQLHENAPRCAARVARMLSAAEHSD